MRQHIEAMHNLPLPSEAIDHVYEIPSIDPAVRYMHAAASSPIKSTWLKSIRRGNYLSWPLIDVKNVNDYFPESEETQRGHMNSQRQVVRCSQPAILPPDDVVDGQVASAMPK